MYSRIHPFKCSHTRLDKWTQLYEHHHKLGVPGFPSSQVFSPLRAVPYSSKPLATADLISLSYKWHHVVYKMQPFVTDHFHLA